jgi:hypothetical protein
LLFIRPWIQKKTLIYLLIGLTGFAQDTTTTVALVNPKLGLGWSEGDISAVIIL